MIGLRASLIGLKCAMITERITDPTTIETAEIETILETGRSATIQFSKADYSPELLAAVNELCRAFGQRIEVRFFGHYSECFDASIVSYLPNVRWLAIDCLTHVRNEDALWRLPLLERLSFGVFEFDNPNFLDKAPLEQLTHLSLSENRKRNFNLASIGRCGNLCNLFVQGHTKGISTLAKAPQLEHVRLSSIPKRQDLSFVNDIQKLKSLEVLLGGRQTIDEIHHPTLEELRIVRVRGLETLGSLVRFPALRVLQIEDQLQMREISVLGSQLHELCALNCKNLEQIIGLSELDKLVHFRACETRLDLDALVQFDWPSSLEVLALYSGNEKWNKKARQELDKRGYREFS